MNVDLNEVQRAVREITAICKQVTLQSPKLVIEL